MTYWPDTFIEARKRYIEHPEEYHTSREEGTVEVSRDTENVLRLHAPECMTDLEQFKHPHVPAYNSPSYVLSLHISVHAINTST